MRKTKQEIVGQIMFKDDVSKKSYNLRDFGHIIKPTYKGLLNGKLVNDRMLIIEMQQVGIKLSTIFHYASYSHKKAFIDEILNNNKRNIEVFLMENYNINSECHLQAKEIYDEDYCVLPLEEAKTDLTQTELQEVIQDMAHYTPAVRATREKRNVLFD